MPGSGTDRRQTRLEGGPAIILVEPQLAENIGMCARAMANFGLSDLRLVAPRDGWPKKGARSAASGAAYILDEAKLFATLAGSDRRPQSRLCDDGARSSPAQARADATGRDGRDGATPLGRRARRHPVRARAQRAHQ